MKELWRAHRVSIGLSLLCFLLAADALLSGQFRALPFTNTAYRRSSEPVVFWAGVAILMSMAIAFPGSLLWSARTRAKRRVPVQDQIHRLRASGIALPEPIAARLRESGSLESYESDPYRGILAAIADPEDGDGPPPRNFFYLDTEAIDAVGDYVALATKMIAISEGTLAATGLKDHLDVGKKTATLEGTVNGTSFRWDLRYEDDYLDQRFFDGFRTVLQQTGSGKVFAGLDLGGQDLLVFCVDDDQINRFKANLGLTLHAL